MSVARDLYGRVISVNVGLPRRVDWRGEKVRTAIWKSPVRGRVMARRLNLEGDGQADLQGHGGENRAMLVYQIESYQYWQKLLGLQLSEFGWFGENLTVSGLADADVCIGDRFRIGETVVEVTQPRVTCYRLGIRTGKTEMPSLLVQHGRPGFYLRVLEEGTIGENDPIQLIADGKSQMSVTSVDQLLYLGAHPVDQLERAIAINALSDGWKRSFRNLLDAQRKGDLNGNPGLSQEADRPSWQGFRSLTVLANRVEAEDIRSVVLGPADGSALADFHPGQHLVLRSSGPEGKPLIRTYSLSSAPDGRSYRVTIKREQGCSGSAYFQDALQPGTTVEVSAPRGTFTLPSSSTRPLVFLSAGIGITPLLSMLHSLAKSDRLVFWIHSARNGRTLCFKNEVHSLLETLPRAKSLLAFTQPLSEDRFGTDFDLNGRLNMESLASLDIPPDAEYYLCGPSSFISVFTGGLMNSGVSQENIHFELFNGQTPSVSRPTPAKAGEATHQIVLTRSGRSLVWSESSGSILELVESEKIPVSWSCRVGVCHACETGLLDGQVLYAPLPLDPPGSGRVLLCCARPTSDITLDL